MRYSFTLNITFIFQGIFITTVAGFTLATITSVLQTSQLEMSLF